MQSGKIEVSIMGRWQPKNVTAESVVGLLECKGDHVELKIVSEVEVDWLDNLDSFDLFGVLEDGRSITLCNCFVNFTRSGWSPAQIFTYGVFVNYYILGMHFDKMQRSIARAYLRFDELGIWYEYRGWESKETKNTIYLRRDASTRDCRLKLCGMSVEFVPFENGKLGGFGKFSFEHGSRLQARIKRHSLCTLHEILHCCNVFEDFVVVACHHLATDFQLEIVVKKRKRGKWEFSSGYVVMRNAFHVNSEVAHPTDCISIDKYDDIEKQLAEWEGNYQKFSPAITLYKKTISCQDGTIDSVLFEHARVAESILTRTISAKKYDINEFSKLMRDIKAFCKKTGYSNEMMSDVISAASTANNKSFKQRLLDFIFEYCDLYGCLFTSKILFEVVNTVVQCRNDYAHANKSEYSRKRLWEVTLAESFLQITVQLLMLKLKGFSATSSVALLSDRWWCLRIARQIEKSVSPESIGIFEGEEE